MRSKSTIENLLIELQGLYDNSAKNSHKVYYSKLALLELCGWLEEEVDAMIMQHVNAKVRDPVYVRYAQNSIVKPVHGCSYQDHVKKMLVSVIGITSVPILEESLRNIGSLQILSSVLDSLWELRKPAAHTTLVGTMQTYDSPSVVKTYLDSLYPVLGDMETELAII